MCLLIHRSKGAQALHDAWIRDFQQRNSDGFGAWWLAKDDKGLPLIRVLKTLDQKKVLKIIRKIEQLDVEAGFHFRMRTHGAVNKENVHPYTVFKSEHRYTTVLAHNGVLGDFTPTKRMSKEAGLNHEDGPSDTAIFIEMALKPLINGFSIEAFYNEKSGAYALIEDYLGGSNKLLLTNANLGFQRLGSNWTEWGGFQMSNLYSWSAEKRFNTKPNEAPVSQAASTSYHGGTYQYWRDGKQHTATYGTSSGSSRAAYDPKYAYDKSEGRTYFREGKYLTSKEAEEYDSKQAETLALNRVVQGQVARAGGTKGSLGLSMGAEPVLLPKTGHNGAKEPRLKMKGGSVKVNLPATLVVGSEGWWTFWDQQRSYYKNNPENDEAEVDTYVDAEITAGLNSLSESAKKEALANRTSKPQAPKEVAEGTDTSKSFHWFMLYAANNATALEVAGPLCKGTWDELAELVDKNPAIASDLLQDCLEILNRHNSILDKMEKHKLRIYIKSDGSLGAITLP